MKENLVIREEYVKSLSNAYELIGSSLREFRYVANNLIPETLHNHGINIALQNFCDSVKKISNININYTFAGANNRLDLGLELAVYRIAKELINNSIKHSYAKSICIRLTINKEKLQLSVSDNGLGFDVTQLSQTQGKGIATIRSRVDALYGKIKIKSSICTGTTVYIEFINPLAIVTCD